MIVYVVLRGDGTPKRTRCGTVAAYAGKSVAKRAARCKGDSVVEATIDTDRTPIHIQGFKLNPKGEWENPDAEP